MANLSNINGKFVVEQTTGYVGVGTTDPNYPIEVLSASAEIALNASGGSIYRVQSDSASNFIIRKAGVGDRLVINSAGNATFAGTISTIGASTFNLGEGIFIKAVNTSNAISASNFWGYGLYEGASRIGEFSMVRDGSSSVYIGTSFAGQKLILGTAAKVPALTIDSSQNSTFAGEVNVTSGASLGSGLQVNRTGHPSLSIITGGNTNAYIGIAPSGGTYVNAITISDTGNATFAGTVTAASNSFKCELDGSANALIDISSTGSQQIRFFDTNSSYTEAMRLLRFDDKLSITYGDNANEEALTVVGTGSSAGNVGIGTNSPDFALDIEAVSSGVQLQIGRTVTSAGSTWMGSDSNGFHLGVGAYGAGNSVSDPNGFSVDTSGNVGIGTTSPTYPLTLSGGAANTNPGTVEAPYIGEELAFKIENPGWSSTNGLIRMIQPTGAYVNNASMTFSTLQGSLTEKMRIENNGNVGIGTTSPGAKLEIAETAASTDCIVRIKATRDAYLQFSPANTTKWGLIADYPALGDFTMYNYPNNFNAIVCKDNKDITTNLSGGNFGIGTTSPDAKLEVASDITIQNGVYTYKTSGYTSGATAINVDITVGNEGGAGNVFKIEAGFAHYFAMTYNSVAEWWCTSRGTSVVNTYILNAGTTLAGDWSASKPNTTTLRITKTAGTYGGGGKWWVKVTYVPF